MTTTAFDVLTRAMRHHPDLIHAVVLIDDDTTDLHHLDDIPCTHKGVTPEHLAICCHDGIECDRCGHLTAFDPNLGPDDAVICPDCANLEEL